MLKFYPNHNNNLRFKLQIPNPKSLGDNRERPCLGIRYGKQACFPLTRNQLVNLQRERFVVPEAEVKGNDCRWVGTQLLWEVGENILGLTVVMVTQLSE